MNTKQYLLQLEKINVNIDQKIKELSELRELMLVQDVKGIRYDKERVQTSKSREAGFVRISNKIVDLEREIDAEIDELVDKKHLIIKQIQSLDNPIFIDILYKRYVEFKSFNRIAFEMHQNPSYTRRVHGYALQDFEKKIQKDTTFFLKV